MQFLAKLPWRRILTIVVGAGTAAGVDPSKLADTWPEVLGGTLMGLAISAERVMQKRKKGAPAFDTAAAEAKVEEMRKVP